MRETLKKSLSRFFVVAFGIVERWVYILETINCARLVYFNFNVCCIIKSISVGRHAGATIVIVDFNLIYSTVFFSWKCLSSLYRENFFMLLKFYYFYSVPLKPFCKSLKSVLYITNDFTLSRLSICTSLMMVFNKCSLQNFCQTGG